MLDNILRSSKDSKGEESKKKSEKTELVENDSQEQFALNSQESVSKLNKEAGDHDLEYLEKNYGVF